jgi:hypothetical protein
MSIFTTTPLMITPSAVIRKELVAAGASAPSDIEGRYRDLPGCYPLARYGTVIGASSAVVGRNGELRSACECGRLCIVKVGNPRGQGIQMAFFRMTPETKAW